MKSTAFIWSVFLWIPFTLFSQTQSTHQAVQVKISSGLIEGTSERSGIRSFKGIPYAEPPIGELRWKEPQPVENWTGVRKADKFGPQAMQKRIYDDMIFRSTGISEDCLYLNVWAPAQTSQEKLPVLVYFYGGGFVAGDGSEPRYDGENMAKKGIVVLTVNYRLGIFGFLAHPELSKESPHHASGNYGLLDQSAALRWVQQNIAAFGGDPNRVTIAGESAGSISVSAQMASPLSKNLIAGAIGESGAMINPTLAPISLEQGEKNGVAFSKKVGATSLADLRAMPATELLEAAADRGGFRLAATVDGYFLPKSPEATFESGEQAQVPLLAGWNSAETSFNAILQGEEPTPENYEEKIKQLYPTQAKMVLNLYPGTAQEQVISSATALASDRFIVYSTWKWIDLHHKTGNAPVYRYLFSTSKPPLKEEVENAAVVQRGAPHAFEIEYAMGNLATNPVYAWSASDYKISETMLTYFANFIKTGDPNGPGLPTWPLLQKGKEASFINIDIHTRQEKAQDRERYLFLDQVYSE